LHSPSVYDKPLHESAETDAPALYAPHPLSQSRPPGREIEASGVTLPLGRGWRAAMKLGIRRLLLGVLLGVLLYGAAVAYTGYQRVHLALSSFHWSAFAAAMRVGGAGSASAAMIDWTEDFAPARASASIAKDLSRTPFGPICFSSRPMAA